MKSTSIGYVVRNHHPKVVMAESKRNGDCAILVAKYLAVREVIFKASQKGIQRIIIESDS